MAYIKKIWKDYPNTTTQIKAEDLNNIENGIDDVDSRLVTAESDIDTAEANITNLQNVTKYITATAGSNGDFYINLGITPYTGMIVYVSFPSATTGTSNARLSINNGTNYYNIYYSGLNVKANEIQNKNITLYFDGTKFITITKTITGNVSVSTFSSSDQTATGTNLTTLDGTTRILRTGGRKLLIIAYSQAYNAGDGYAYNMNVVIGSNAINMCLNNGTTKNTIMGSKILDNIPAGEYSTYLSIIGTNASSNILIPSFSPYGYSIIEI